MKKIFFISIIALLLLGSEKLYSQVISKPLNRAYEKLNTPKRKPIQYVYLREADMMWTKRVWRKIDLREKINQPFYYPTTRVNDRVSLMQLIWDAVTAADSKIQAWDDDDFTIPLTAAEIIKQSTKTDSNFKVQSKLNPDQDSTIIKVDKMKLTDITTFQLKEDWFFDRQRSVMEARILGIAAIQAVKNEDGSFKYNKQLFWIYFPDLRPLFAVTEVFNRQNDAERRTYDDVFWKRQFGSFVYKEENVYDRKIEDYAGTNIDGLLEAERVKNDIFIKEHDLWEY